MKENDFSEKIALYFYFSFLDEAKAQAATTKVLKKIHQGRRFNQGDGREGINLIDLVRLTESFNLKSRRAIKPMSLAFAVGHIVIPENSNWGPWFEFRKLANDKNFNAVLYSKILGVNENEIAEGLGVPVGTVRYRIGHGLKLLGSICQHGAPHA